jgi:hypothetical protein
MKTLLALTAAVAVSGLAGGGASAKTKSYTISLGGSFCVVANVNVKGTQVTANENDSCQTYVGGGFLATITKKAGKQAIIGGVSNEFPGAEILINLSYPFVTGGKYAVYVTGDGVTLTNVGSGNYTVE